MGNRVFSGSHLESAECFYALAIRQEANVPEAVSRHVRECDCCSERGAQPVESRGGAPVRPRVRRVLQAVTAVAAVIPLLVLFHYTHGSSGTTMAKVARTLGRARNVRVVSLNPQNEQVVYELWIARDLGLTGIMSSQGCVVYDLTREEKEDVVSGAVARMEDIEVVNLLEMSDGILNFTMNGGRSNAAWTLVASSGNREVYEFAWMGQTSSGRDLPTRQEVTIDTARMLPLSLRLFRMDPSLLTEWECQSVIVFEYLTDDQVKSVMAGEPIAGD